MNDKVKHLEYANNYVAMAINELKKANIVMVNDECWVSAMNAAVNLYSAKEMLEKSINEMKY